MMTSSTIPTNSCVCGEKTTSCPLSLWNPNAIFWTITCVGSVLLLVFLVLCGVTTHMCHKVRRLKRSKEETYKRSKTCMHCNLSLRERQEWAETWDDEHVLASFVPTITIGSTFHATSHGPTPSSPPPATKEVSHAVYSDEGTDSSKDKVGQTLKPLHSKTLPRVLERRCPKDVDNDYCTMAEEEPLYHTLDCQLGQTDRDCQSGLRDAWCNQPNGWHRYNDDYSHYSRGKISEVQSLRSEENINENNILDVNEILKHAYAIKVIHVTTSTENMYQTLASAKEEDTMPKHLNPVFSQSIASYIDTSAPPTLSNEEKDVQMKITLNMSAAAEICRKARLRGISCIPEVMYGQVMGKPTNYSVDCGVAGEDYADMNTFCPEYIEITD